MVQRNPPRFLAEIRRSLYTAVLSDVPDGLGFPDQAMPPSIRPLDEDLVLAGFARTGLYREVFREVDGLTRLPRGRLHHRRHGPRNSRDPGDVDGVVVVPRHVATMDAPEPRNVPRWVSRHPTRASAVTALARAAATLPPAPRSQPAAMESVRCRAITASRRRPITPASRRLAQIKPCHAAFRSRLHWTGWASGNTQVRSTISLRGRYCRT